MRMARILQTLSRPLQGARDLLRARRGSMAPMLALTMPVIMLVVVGSIDFSMSVSSKSDLQDAADAASLAVATATAANPNTPESTLRTLAATTLTANFKGGAPTLTDFHVCAPAQNDCTDNGTALKTNTVTLAASAPTNCSLAAVLPAICGNGNPTVNAQTTTVIGFGANMQLNIVMDSSASMIVGATAADVQLIENWTGYSTQTRTQTGQTCTGHGRSQTCTPTYTTTTSYPNWNSIKPSDPGPAFSGGDNPPCAFACHDVGDSTTTADIQLGLSNAHTAGATTRFDVMTSAATQLVSSLQASSLTNATLAKNTYLFNIYSFDTAVHTWGSSNMNFTDAMAAVTTVVPGLDTYLSNAMSTLISKIGSNGSGASAASPLKFMILVTDGLQSSRDANWSGTSTGYDSAWNFSPTTFGGYATTISNTQCNQIKSNGVILAVLETPYVPLTGQSPAVQPYEKTVRHVIYPNGPGSTSAVSTALQNCASTGYYFQAVNSKDIATGFLTLTNKFIAQSSYISK
jgi:Flp pilus assembly protein TadG